jgi:hypothetical protein
MTLDPAWIGVVGTGGGAVIGALGSSLVEWAKVTTQGKQQRLSDADRREHDAAEAKAVRDAEAAEKAAQRKHDEREALAQRQHDERTALRIEQVNQIREWREGLAAAHADYKKWIDDEAPEPNIVSAVWFQDLRRHLSSTGIPTSYETDSVIQCDVEDMNKIGDAIRDLQQQWLDD